jgi:two-component system nitrate/nitrite response regulator NarL
MDPAKILLVDDHTLFRHGVRDVIARQRDLQIVGEAATCRDALLQARASHPDLILMDIYLSDGNGFETVHTIKQELPDAKIIVLTVHDEDVNLFKAIKSGAEGFLSKNVRANILVESLRGAMRGEAALSRRMAAKVLHEYARLARAGADCMAGAGSWPANR